MRISRLALLVTAAAGAVLPLTAAPVDAATARYSQLLAKLTLAAESNAGYRRDGFRHWVDADGDGCDTRKEVLIAESRVPAKTGRGCSVTGRWVSVYDATTVTSASALDIDHVVALAEAWGSGASTWDARTRQAFANDLVLKTSLIAVTAASNRSKADKDPNEWLPPAQNYRCTYVGHWLQVKYRWSLTVDRNERTKLAGLIKSCRDPQITVPTKARIGRTQQSPPASPRPPAAASPTPAGTPVPSAAAGTATPTPAQPSAASSPGPTSTAASPTSGAWTTPTSSPTGGPTSATDPRYGSCGEAKAHGYGPYYRGHDTEYGWYRDGDGDGTVCE